MNSRECLVRLVDFNYNSLVLQHTGKFYLVPWDYLRFDGMLQKMLIFTAYKCYKCIYSQQHEYLSEDLKCRNQLLHFSEQSQPSFTHWLKRTNCIDCASLSSFMHNSWQQWHTGLSSFSIGFLSFFPSKESHYLSTKKIKKSSQANSLTYFLNCHESNLSSNSVFSAP